MKDPSVERDGRPSWSYNQADVVPVDSVHGFVLTASDKERTGAAWKLDDDAYSSTNTLVAIPVVMADPEPTRTTAKLNALNVGDGVVVEVNDGVCEEVCVCEDVCDEVVDGVLLQDPTKTGAAEKGAAVTPRKTVFAGADASVVLVSAAVLYE